MPLAMRKKQVDHGSCGKQQEVAFKKPPLLAWLLHIGVKAVQCLRKPGQSSKSQHWLSNGAASELQISRSSVTKLGVHDISSSELLSSSEYHSIQADRASNQPFENPIVLSRYIYEMIRTNTNMNILKMSEI